MIESVFVHAANDVEAARAIVNIERRQVVGRGRVGASWLHHDATLQQLGRAIKVQGSFGNGATADGVGARGVVTGGGVVVVTGGGGVVVGGNRVHAAVDMVLAPPRHTLAPVVRCRIVVDGHSVGAAVHTAW